MLYGVQVVLANRLKMEKTKEIKLMIIENYIDWLTTDEDEREEMKDNAKLYVDEDWVDEIAQSNIQKK